MVILWRKLVTWLRAILLKISRKEKIEWCKEIIELLAIIGSMLDKQIPQPEPIDPTKPVTPPIPNYDIIGKIPRPKRRLLDWLLRR